MTPPLAAWGLTGTPTPLPGGHRNVVLRVGAHVLKTTRRSEAALQWLAPVQEAAKTAELGAPRLIPATTGTLSVHGWTCEPFVPGHATSPVEIADRIARFHMLAGSLPQRPGFASVRDLLTTPVSGDIDLGKMPGDLVARLRTAWSSLIGEDETIIHADLNPSNILTASDGTITLIDWDEAHRNLRAMENGVADDVGAAARQAWEIATCWQIEPTRARSLAKQFSN